MRACASKGEFCETKDPGCRTTKRFAFLKNKFETSECTGSDHNQQKEENSMVDCAEVIVEAAKSLCLEQS